MNGDALFQRHWPIPEPAASVIIVHGYAEHSGRYEPHAQRLNERGYEVHSFDHYAHGQSPGEMGLITSMDRLVDDLSRIATEIWNRPNAPKIRFIWGHSMGGLVTTLYLERDQPALNGVILSSALLDTGDVNPVLKLISPILAKLMPRYPAADLEDESISRIEEEVDKYSNDPLVYHGPIPAATGHQFMRGAQQAQQNLSRITTPLLAIHGTADRLVPQRASQILYDGVTSTDKTLKLYEDAYHEVHNDQTRQEFQTDILNWLDAHR